MADDADVAAFRSFRARLRMGWQVKWIVTVAGAIAMTIIAGILVWKVITSPHPLAELTPAVTRTAQQAQVPR